MIISNLTETMSRKSHYNNIMDTNKILQLDLNRIVRITTKRGRIPTDIQRRQFADGKKMYEIIFGWVDEGYGHRVGHPKTFKPFSDEDKPNETAYSALNWDIKHGFLICE